MATDRQNRANRANRRLWRGHTADGLRRLREAAWRNQPWLRSTGPQTALGKEKAKMNALQHGARSHEVLAGYRALRDLIRQARVALLAEHRSV